MSVERDFCRSCGRRVLDDSIAGICSVCGKKLCSNCVRRGKDGRYYCIEDYDPGEPPVQEQPQKSGWCFIATAAYGTPMAQEINVLRAFRDHALLSNRVGQALTTWYYRLSPPLAMRVQAHPWRRWAVRLVLDPLVRIFRRLGY